MKWTFPPYPHSRLPIYRMGNFTYQIVYFLDRSPAARPIVAEGFATEQVGQLR
jgi:hypothetical protein